MNKKEDSIQKQKRFFDDNCKCMYMSMVEGKVDPDRFIEDLTKRAKTNPLHKERALFWISKVEDYKASEKITEAQEAKFKAV